MRLARLSCALLAAGAFAAPLAAGVNRWTRIGPYGGNVSALAAAASRPGVVYAGLREGGVFRSADAGRTWAFAGTGLVDNPVSALAVHPRRPATVYAATSLGLRQTRDGGATWSPVGGRAGRGSTNLVVIDPANPSTLYAGLDGLLVKSLDGGATWRRGGGWPRRVASLAVDPLRPQTAYAASSFEGAFKSTDGGTTWTRLERGLPADFSAWLVAVDPRHPRRVLLAGFGGSGLFRSGDGGATWSRPAELGGAFVTALAFDAAGSGAYAAAWNGGTGRIWRSGDGGRSWRAVFDVPPGFGVSGLLAPPGGLLAGTARGVYASADRGASWQASNAGLSGLVVNGLAVAEQTPPRLYAGAPSAGLFKSADRGGHWLRLNADLGPRGSYRGPLEVAPRDPLAVYAGFPEALGASDDGGRRWRLLVEDLACLHVGRIVPDPFAPGTLYLALVAVGSRLCPPSSCRGLAITPQGQRCLTDPAAGSLGVLVLAADPHAPGHLYATNLGRLFHSLDGGASWSALADVLPGALVFHPLLPGVVYGSFAGAVGRSLDGGATWDLASAGLPSGVVPSALAIDPVDGSVLYAATVTEGVFRSADGGRAWSEVAPGLEGLLVFDLAVDPRDPSILYASTYGASILSVDQEP